jgi:hypothetical protein
VIRRLGKWYCLYLAAWLLAGMWIGLRQVMELHAQGMM